MTGEATDLVARCGCARCVEATIERQPGVFIGRKMIVCSDCGNKRCPHATDHRLSCTNSNEAGQEGSNYGPPLYRRDQATLIEAQAAEIEGLRAALQPFSVYYQINDLDERLADDAIEVPVGDLRQAHRILTTTQEGPNP